MPKTFTGEKRASSISGAEKNGKPHVTKMKLNLYLSHCVKLNSKWIKDLSTRTESLCLIEEEVGPNLHHVSLGSDFLKKLDSS